MTKINENTTTYRSPGTKGYTGYVPTEKYASYKSRLAKIIKKTTGYDLIDLEPLDPDTIDVNDNSGNSATYVYKFYIGEPISTEEISETITTESELSETEGTYFNGLWVFLAISLLSIITKISSIKRNNIIL